MVTCGNCGAQVSIDGQRFCARCGVKLPETETQTTFLHAVQEPKVPPFCGQCGAKTSIEGQIFCLKCGARLLPTQQQTAPQSQQFQSVPQFTHAAPTAIHLCAATCADVYAKGLCENQSRQHVASDRRHSEYRVLQSLWTIWRRHFVCVRFRFPVSDLLGLDDSNDGV